jgi:hypothetical protein
MTRQDLIDGLEYIQEATHFERSLAPDPHSSIYLALESLFDLLGQAAQADLACQAMRVRIAAARRAAEEALGARVLPGNSWAGAIMRLSAEYLAETSNW